VGAAAAALDRHFAIGAFFGDRSYLHLTFDVLGVGRGAISSGMRVAVFKTKLVAAAFAGDAREGERRSVDGVNAIAIGALPAIRHVFQGQLRFPRERIRRICMPLNLLHEGREAGGHRAAAQAIHLALIVHMHFHRLNDASFAHFVITARKNQS
jgi:hypothetical protein